MIQQDAENPSAYFNRGTCYDSIGKIDLAIEDYSFALGLEGK
jgi:lipoprotein NlpI